VFGHSQSSAGKVLGAIAGLTCASGGAEPFHQEAGKAPYVAVKHGGTETTMAREYVVLIIAQPSDSHKVNLLVIRLIYKHIKIPEIFTKLEPESDRGVKHVEYE
jgi:hypothetical protein